MTATVNIEGDGTRIMENNGMQMCFSLLQEAFQMKYKAVTFEKDKYLLR